MMKTAMSILACLSLSLALSACGGTPTPEPTTSQGPATTPAPAPTPTPAPTPEPAPASSYQITLRPLAGSDPRMLAAAQRAAALWQQTITGDVNDARVRLNANSCGNQDAVDETVDDLVIFVGTQSIDGPGKVLGQSGPCTYRAQGYQPSSATLVLDTADIAGLSDDQLTSLLAHEMGHSLGIGTMWDITGLIGGTDTDPRFKGPAANAEYAALGGSGGVPLENTGGEGTALAHWREKTFTSELMTGWLERGVNPLGRVTVASLADLGYTVNFSQVKPTAPLGGLSALGTQTLESLEQRLTRPVPRPQ